MVVLICVQKNNPCELHKGGKYTHWGCMNSEKEITKAFYLANEKRKITCPDCNIRRIYNTSPRCRECHFKVFVSPLLGTKLPKWWRKRISDGQGKQEESPFWKGEDASYWTKHKWIVKMYGNPEKCVDCGKMGSRDNGGKWSIQWANISGEYERNRRDYKGLCRVCHAIFDKKTKNIEDYKHGTQGKYIKGCRCSLCRKAKSLYRKGKIKHSTVL